MKVLHSFLLALPFLFLALSCEYAHSQAPQEIGPVIDRVKRNGGCGVDTPKVWKEAARVILGNPDSYVTTTKPGLRSIQKTRYISRLGAYAYSRLYARDKRLFWLLSGAFAATAFGEEIIDPMWDNASSGGNNPVFSLSFLYNADPRAAHEFGIGAFAIFDDIYWPHLAYHACGLDVITRIFSKKKAQGGVGRHSPEVAEAYWYAFALINEGKTAEAALRLAYLEQWYVIQEATFNGWLAKIGGYLGANESMPINHWDFKATGFLTYSKQTGHWQNYANREARWNWISMIMPKMIEFFGRQKLWVNDRLKVINYRAKEVL